VGQGGKATLATAPDADILREIVWLLTQRVRAGRATFLIKVKSHRGEPINERADNPKLDGIGLDMIKKELLTIEFKRTRDARSNYVEKTIAVAQEQYTSLLTGLQEVGQVKGWKVQQLVFVGGTCGSVHVESFNENMKALGVLESKWDLVRQKPVRRLLEEQDKVLRAYFAQKGGARSQRGTGIQGKGREHVKWDMYA
jgi:hypothetical protein